MKLVLACPNCGNTNWKETLTEEDEFVCTQCGEKVFPEEMEAVDYADMLRKEKSLSLQFPTRGGYWDIVADYDPSYLGLDVQFVSEAQDALENDQLFTAPRIVWELPNETDPCMHAYCWTDPKQEDYSQKVTFDNFCTK